MLPTITKKLDDCSREQLLYFATKVKGLSIGATTNRAGIIAKIRQVWHEDEIEVPEPKDAPSMKGTPPADAKAAAAPKVGKGKVIVPLVNITLFKHDKDPSGSRDLELIFQNRAFMVPRGVPCRIPWYYFEILRNAIRDHCTPQKDDAGNFLMGAGALVTQMQEHPFQVNQMPPRQQVQAYLDSVGGRWDDGLDAFYDAEKVLEPEAA